MTINVRQKGQEGEREIAKILNLIVAKVRDECKLKQYAKEDELFQRNQNQSAVGGSDLSNPLYLEIEVKRQEDLSVNSWWKQCITSAERTGGIPILIFRQNRKKWRVCMQAELPLFPECSKKYLAMPRVRVEVELDTFKEWFKMYYSEWVKHNADREAGTED